jgi:hypothetical protein
MAPTEAAAKIRGLETHHRLTVRSTCDKTAKPRAKLVCSDWLATLTTYAQSLITGAWDSWLRLARKVQVPVRTAVSNWGLKYSRPATIT